MFDLQQLAADKCFLFLQVGENGGKLSGRGLWEVKSVHTIAARLHAHNQ